MDLKQLKEQAIAVTQNAYAPHSQYKVGCVIKTTNGNVYPGCNVEAISLIFTICAERNAITTAIASQGKMEIDTVVIYSPTPKPSPPCGSCRQMIFEFGKNARVYSFCDSDEFIDSTIKELLPMAFDFEVLD